jgi:hypothetical protein
MPTGPVIHIPLIIRTPGQQEGRTVNFAPDQTSLAPTLNRDGQADGEGLAFNQYFETNSVFKPLRDGSVGVIDGQYQYVVYLDSQKGVLGQLNEAQIWNLDRSAENSAKAQALRAAIHARFLRIIQLTK